jgi:cell division protein FtsI/penicillin-binding protein 2/cell division protein FtsW (lipid II flippase)
MSRRNTELALLGAVSPIVLGIFAMLYAHQTSTLTLMDFAVPGGLLLAFAAAHVALRRLAPAADPALLPIAALLSGVGLAFVTRLDPKLGATQTLWLLGGVVAMVVTLMLVPSLERLARYKYTIMLAGLGLLLLPAVVGSEINGAKLWLRFGGFSFQPGELAKILVVIFLAAYLAENREVLSVSTKRVLGMRMPSARHFAPLLVMWAVSLVVMVYEKDLGSSLLFFGVFLAMIYTATGRPSYVVVGLVLFAVGATGAYYAFGHVRTRVDIWLHPFADAAGKGYQLVQSLFALAAGGMVGRGIGAGLPTRIPFVATDFIFSAIGEELGLLGGVAICIACLVFCLRGLATATRARSDMAALTATGLVAAFGLQTFVIIGGVSRLIPLTGITLPFVSYGGSSILSNFILLALLLRAGDETPGEEFEQVSSGATSELSGLALSRRMQAIAVAIAVLTTALAANLTWVQVVQAQALANNPANTRNLAAEMHQERGAIMTRDGVVLARSVAGANGVYKREYPSGTLAAHVTGYFSPKYGRAGVEAIMNDVLTGHRAYSSWSDVIDAAAGKLPAGNDVVLTIDSRIQAAAEAALTGHRGAVVVVDPRTGAVLAMASSPTYDPNSVDSQWASLAATGSAAPLLDRAIRSTYPPGSTFKVVTLTAALSSGVATPGTTYPGPASLDIGGGKVTNFESGAYGDITLKKATEESVNTVFAQVAVALGAKRLVDQARAFGFDKPDPLELSTVPSVMPAPETATTWETAWAGVGQPVGLRGVAGPVSTPLQMALVAAGIANGGLVMRPYIVDHAADRAGAPLTTAIPLPWTTATDPTTAAAVRDLMISVVQNGSGTRAAIKGITVAGKTGTAEASKKEQTHAWFIAFAPAEHPTVAMAIILENAGVGGQVAAPAAKGVLQAALASQGK